MKPEFFLDTDLAKLPCEIRLFYAGMWCHADREGRLEDDPLLLKAVIFPYDNFDIEAMLEKLSQTKKAGKPYIIRYAAEGKNFIQIVKFLDHQKPHHTERNSTIPPPNGYLTVKAPLLNGTKNKNKKKKKNKKKNYGKSPAAPAGVDGAPPAPQGIQPAITPEDARHFRDLLAEKRKQMGLK